MQAAHDAAMLDVMEDWQLSSRESLTDLLFNEGQSRETFKFATSNVYASWENGVWNLQGDKPEGTGWEEGNSRFQEIKNTQTYGNRPISRYGYFFDFSFIVTIHQRLEVPVSLLRQFECCNSLDPLQWRIDCCDHRHHRGRKGRTS